jgi:hypothetical protein
MVRLRLTVTVTLGGLVTLFVLVTAPAQATHPRPAGATPLRMSLVPAYSPCAAPNRTHGPPLAFASCNPPAQTSAQATVGTPDAFGGGANSTGYLRLRYFLGAPSANDDADILLYMTLSDVRCVPAGARCGTANASGPADYSGELRLSFAVRITDHYNATSPFGGTDTATVEDFTMDRPAPQHPHPVPLDWACAQSGSTSTGSTCSLNTSMNAVIPGSVKDAKRSVWALDAVRIYDGGADGDGDTAADNTVFARPGIFIP